MWDDLRSSIYFVEKVATNNKPFKPFSQTAGP